MIEIVGHLAPSQAIHQMAVDPRVFRGHLLIDTDRGPRRLEESLDDWQRKDFEALDPSWQRVAGRGLPGELNDAPSRAYLERPRGHSKTADLAVMVCWVLLSSIRRLSGIAAAADRDQAGYLRDAISRLVQVNPWLNEILEVQRGAIVNKLTHSRLDVISCDAPSSYGLTPDFVVVDELTHWGKQDFWESVVSSAAKRAHCLLVIISNAGLGMGESWQWRVREHARQDDRCYFSRLDGPQASWLCAAMLIDQKKLLTKSSYARLWLNQWQRGAGDALDPDDVAAAFKSDLQPMHGREEGFSFVGGLDLGIKNDHAALVVLGSYGGCLDTRIDLFGRLETDARTAENIGRQQRVRLALCKSWAPSEKTGEVDLIEVERFCLAAAKQFSIGRLFYDPHQAALMAQRVARAGVWMEELPFVGANLNRMASAVLAAFSSRQIDLYPDADLERDLLRLSIVEKAYGFKLEAIRDEYGHADRAIALAIALPAALELASQDSESVVIEMEGLLGSKLPPIGSGTAPRREAIWF